MATVLETRSAAAPTSSAATSWAAFLRSRRERITPRPGRPPLDPPPAHARPSPRGGGAARRRRRHLVHVARAGPRHQRLARRCSTRSRRTLRFDAHERAAPVHAGRHGDTSVAEGARSLSPAVQLILDQLEPYPALAVNARYDILAYNRVWLSPDLAVVKPVVGTVVPAVLEAVFRTVVEPVEQCSVGPVVGTVVEPIVQSLHHAAHDADRHKPDDAEARPRPRTRPGRWRTPAQAASWSWAGWPSRSASAGSACAGSPRCAVGTDAPRRLPRPGVRGSRPPVNEVLL